MYETLAHYNENMGEYEKEIEALRNRYEIFEELFGHSDKKSIKAKRNLAMTLLKRERMTDAINELEDVLEIEEKVYG